MSMLYKVTYPCEKVREFMYDYLDESLPTLTSIRFHLHLNGCVQCREYLFLYKKAANTKDFRKTDPPPDEFLASTLDFLEKQGITGPGEDGAEDWQPGEMKPSG
ncbi:MAG: zf-HC2 domain-containing protein [Fibrobacterota bacterium]|nr:zf-HC2 domain-containing protein [Fibrobacterota bacterium]